MSRSKHVFRLVARNLPGLILCKDLLVVPPTELILRCFLLETTTEKNRVYLWKVVVPLYRPMSGVILTYGERIFPGGRDLYIDRNDYAVAASSISNFIVEEGHLESLQQVKGPEDFIQHAHWVGPGSPFLQRLDRALTRCLVEDVQAVAETLRALEVEIERLDAERQGLVRPIVSRLLHTIQANPAEVRSLLHDWAAANVERLGLFPSRRQPA